MTHFFGTLGIDIDDPIYAENGSSKGSRLRSFLSKTTDQAARKILHALWEHRITVILRNGGVDPVVNAEARYLSVLKRLTTDASPDSPPADEQPSSLDIPVSSKLLAELLRIRGLSPQQRGYDFERFLTCTFEASGLSPREPFSNLGEQIDGSFLLDGEIYLVEARWRDAPSNSQDLNSFHGKLDGKAAWARGLFVSFNGFSRDAIAAFHGRRMILMSGDDIHDSLERGISLATVLQKKVRIAGETGKFFVPLQALFRT
jgi:hypothetical protein